MKRTLAAVAICLSALAATGTTGCKLETRSPALAEQAKVPDFSLPSHQGGRVALADLVRNGPAVIVFYRGYW